MNLLLCFDSAQKLIEYQRCLLVFDLLQAFRFFAILDAARQQHERSYEDVTAALIAHLQGKSD